MRQSKKKTVDDRFIKITQTLWVDSIELIFDMDSCIGCELCRQVCPKESLGLEKQGERTVPHVDLETCSLCGLCATFCPTRAVTMVARNTWKGTEEEVIPILDVGASRISRRGCNWTRRCAPRAVTSALKPAPGPLCRWETKG